MSNFIESGMAIMLLTGLAIGSLAGWFLTRRYLLDLVHQLIFGRRELTPSTRARILATLYGKSEGDFIAQLEWYERQRQEHEKKHRRSSP